MLSIFDGYNFILIEINPSNVQRWIHRTTKRFTLICFFFRRKFLRRSCLSFHTTKSVIQGWSVSLRTHTITHETYKHTHTEKHKRTHRVIDTLVMLRAEFRNKLTVHASLYQCMEIAVLLSDSSGKALYKCYLILHYIQARTRV